jgi:hypothetical protein
MPRSDTKVSRVRNVFTATIEIVGIVGLRAVWMPEVVVTAAFWRGRAEEWRAVANETTDPEEKRLLLELVADYERLAERAAKREQSQT